MVVSSSNPKRPRQLIHESERLRPSRGPDVTHLRGGLSGTGERRRSRRFRQETSSARANPFVRAVWSILIVLLICGGGLVMLLKMRRSGGERVASAASADEFLQDKVEAAEPEPEKGEWQGLLPADLAKRFTSAIPPEEKVPLVINPGEIEEEVLKFFREGEGSREVVKDVSEPVGFATARGVYEGFKIDFENARPRVLCVLITEEGGKVDFKSYARWNSVPWGKIVAGEADRVDELRVKIDAGNYYNGEYSDDSKWFHLVASTDGEEETLDLYVKRGGLAERIIKDMLSIGKHAVTISVKVVDGPGSKPVLELEKLVALGWNEGLDLPGSDES